MKKILLSMCMMLLSFVAVYAQSHTITRRSNNNNSTMSKTSPTRSSSSGKKRTGNPSGAKTRTSSGKQTTTREVASGERDSAPITSQSEGISSNRNTESAFFTSCPDNNHPHLIDLGLPSGTKWACCNVGASKPEDYGSYYAWGETKEKTTYNWSTYIHCEGSQGTCHNLGSGISETKYDVAHVTWGEPWVMPSCGQIKELMDNCTYMWTTFNGITGGKFTSKKNGNYVFLPSAGDRCDGKLIHSGSNGYYWSATQDLSNSSNAYDLIFDYDHVYWFYCYRYYGHTIRLVSR